VKEIIKTHQKEKYWGGKKERSSGKRGLVGAAREKETGPAVGKLLEDRNKRENRGRASTNGCGSRKGANSVILS